jgi:hypothetical protein
VLDQGWLALEEGGDLAAELGLAEGLGMKVVAPAATPTRRPASGPARAHLGGSPLSWTHLVLVLSAGGTSR